MKILLRRKEGEDLFLGHDPGLLGAMVVLTRKGEMVSFIKGDATDQDLSDWIGQYSKRIRLAVSEKVGAMPGNGSASMFKFGFTTGLIRGMLAAHGLRRETATPQVWQKEMKCMSGGDKKVTRTRAQELFPRQKVTHQIADALLIAEYCRRVALGRKL